MRDTTDQPRTAKSTIAGFAEKRPIVLFFLLAYLRSWTIWFSMYWIVPEGKTTSTFDAFLIVLFTISGFGPTIAALITNWLAVGSLKICRVWTGWRNCIRRLVFGLGAFVVVTLILPTASAANAPLSAWQRSALLYWSTCGINFSTFFGGPVNEEPGWRGFVCRDGRNVMGQCGRH